MEKRTLLEARLQQLFYQWLLLPETQNLVDSLKFDKACGSESYSNANGSKHEDYKTSCVKVSQQVQGSTTSMTEELNNKSLRLCNETQAASSSTHNLINDKSNPLQSKFSDTSSQSALSHDKSKIKPDTKLEQAFRDTLLVPTTPFLSSDSSFENKINKKNTLESPTVRQSASSHFGDFSYDLKNVDETVLIPNRKPVEPMPCSVTQEIHACKEVTLNANNNNTPAELIGDSISNNPTLFHLYIISSNILGKPYKFISKYSTNIMLPNQKQCLLLEDIRASFPIDIYPHGISVIQFEDILKYKLNMSKYLAPPLFYKLKNECTGCIPQKSLLDYAEANFFIDDPNRTFFNIISNHPTQEYFDRKDLQPFLEVILDKLPGLDFLKAEPEYQQRYMQTVTTRFFYTLDYDGVGYITLKDLYYFEKTQRHEFAANCKILDAMLLNDLNEFEKPCFTLADIWNSLEASLTTTYERFFFSYENFYVIYYLFCQLDSNNNFLLDAQDLLKYDQCAFSLETVNRILDVFETASATSQKNVLPKTLTYEDFIMFLMNDEDKTTAQSLTFWFNVVDLNGDGCLTFNEISFFFDKQQEKMESLKQEPVPLQNILCQINDIFEKKNKVNFTLSDFIKSRKISGFFFDAILSCTKALAFEYRDPYQARQELNDYPFFSPWDRFALRQYYNLICTDKDYESKAVE